MLLKINLQLKLSVHQKQHLYSLLGITLAIILIQSMVKIHIMVFNQLWLLMEISIVNPNKERLFLEIRNKVGLPLILTKVFRSENMLYQITQLSSKLFWGQLSRKNFRTIFQTLYGTVLTFSSNSVQSGLATWAQNLPIKHLENPLSQCYQ